MRLHTSITARAHKNGQLEEERVTRSKLEHLVRA